MAIETTHAIQDFSELHAPAGALGRMPASREEWDRYRLSNEQVGRFIAMDTWRACRCWMSGSAICCARSCRN